MSVTINLDFYNYDKWKSQMNGFERKLNKAVSDGIEEFISRFKLKLIENATYYGITDPYVIGNIVVRKYKGGFLLTINSEQVEYIEYGVGIVGKNSPHPKPQRGWKYDINNHGTKGWVYPVITESDEMFNDVKIKSKDGSTLAWTKGHEPRPFVYKTWLWGTRSITQIVEKHIRKIKL